LHLNASLFEGTVQQVYSEHCFSCQLVVWSWSSRDYWVVTGNHGSTLKLRCLMGPGCHWGGKSPNSGLICYLRLWLYTVWQAFKKHFLGYCVRKQQKQCLLIKATHALVYMYSLLCVFIWQYGNEVEYISMGQAQMGAKGGHLGQFQTVARAPLPSS